MRAAENIVAARLRPRAEQHLIHSSMTPEIGQFALVLALLLRRSIKGVFPMLGAGRGDVRLMASARSAAIVQFLLVLLSFGALSIAHATDDFSVLNVVQNSHSAKPFIYKLSGVWGNHEGSMLLWALILAGYGLAVAATAPVSALRAPRARDSGAGRGVVSRLHHPDIQPLCARLPGAGERPGPQSVAAGSRSRDPSAFPLSRVCRLFDRVCVRRSRIDRWAD